MLIYVITQLTVHVDQMIVYMHRRQHTHSLYLINDRTIYTTVSISTC